MSAFSNERIWTRGERRVVTRDLRQRHLEAFQAALRERQVAMRLKSFEKDLKRLNEMAGDEPAHKELVEAVLKFSRSIFENISDTEAYGLAVRSALDAEWFEDAGGLTVETVDEMDGREVAWLGREINKLYKGLIAPDPN